MWSRLWGLVCGSSRRGDAHLGSHLKEFLRPKDVTRLHSVLRKMRIFCEKTKKNEKGDEISLEKLFDVFKFSKSDQILLRPFFSFIEDDMTFPVFCFYLWNICTLSSDTALARHMFGVLSPQGADVICERHMVQMLKIVNEDAYNSHRQDLFEALSGVKHNAHTFSLFCKDYEVFLGPVKHLRNRLQRSILGERFWRRCSVIRNMHEGRNGCDGIRELVTYYYEVNTKHILKESNTRGSAFIRGILKKITYSEFIDSPYDIICRMKSETINHCVDCNDKFSPVKTPLALKCGRMPLLRFRSFEDFANFETQTNRRSLSKSFSATIVFSPQPQSDSLCETGDIVDREKYNSRNIYMFQSYDHSIPAVRNDSRGIFQSVSSITESEKASVDVDSSSRKKSLRKQNIPIQNDNAEIGNKTLSSRLRILKRNAPVNPM